MSGWLFIIFLLLLGGLISTLGDLLGSKIGKARFSVLKLRPKKTAILITILTGSLISASSLSLMILVNRQLRVGLLLLQGLSSRILQTETMIETLTHRDMSSRLVSFLMVLCRDFGVASEKGITIDLRLSHQAIAEAIGSTRVTITRLLGDLKDSGLLNIERKKITVFDPIALAKRFN